MGNRTDNRAARRRALRAQLAPRRRGGLLGGFIAAVVAVVLIAGVIALQGGSGEPTATVSPSVSASPSASGKPATTPKAGARASGSPAVAPIPKSTETACGGSTGGTMLEPFDSTSGWTVTEGHGALTRDANNKAQGRAALFINNGTQPDETWARKTFSAQNLDDAREFAFWILQEGNFVGNTAPIRVRLLSGSAGYFEHAVSWPQVAKSTRWCQDRASRSDWTASGSADWSRITGVEVNVPGYVSGARNTLGFDALRYS